MVKNLPLMQDTRVWSLDWEDPLEKGMATYSSILAWRIPWTEEPGGLQSMGLQRDEHNWATNTILYYRLLKMLRYRCNQGKHRSPNGGSGKEPTCQCRKCKWHGFNPWLGKILLKEGMETHSSFLSYRIPWTEEPGGLRSIGSQRVKYG